MSESKSTTSHRELTVPDIRDKQIKNAIDALFRMLLAEKIPSVMSGEPIILKEEVRAPHVDDRILSLSSEVQQLKNQINKYLKVELREEAVDQFRELISKIDEISEVYAFHEANETLFWIFYDRGDRMNVLEKIVDVECNFERLFPNLRVDYRILPYSALNFRIASKGELIHKRTG